MVTRKERGGREKLGGWGYQTHTVLCCVWLLSRVLLFVTAWTVAFQAPLSMGFSRQEYWRGLPCPPPWDLSNPGIEPRSPALQVDSLPSEPPGKPQIHTTIYEIGSMYSTILYSIFCNNL